MKPKKSIPFDRQFDDPYSMLLSLIGAEVLTKRDEDGPLARPYRIMPGHSRKTGSTAPQPRQKEKTTQ